MRYFRNLVQAQSSQNFTVNFLSYDTLYVLSGVMKVTIQDGGRPPYWKDNYCYNVATVYLYQVVVQLGLVLSVCQIDPLMYNL